ncbi:MAG: hypothetical protein HZA93_27075 [Verrucomicrobia bacterium]|nr:hypothetical protein [Verrucomicrobiota bacterium]
MPDEPDPPRKFYGFKPREFERANTPPPSPTDAPAPAPPGHLGPTSGAPAGKIDVRDLVRTGAGTGPQLGANKVVNRANDVHGILRDNLKNDLAAGHYELGPLDDSVRRRRIRKYWILVGVVNLPVGTVCVLAGPTNPFPFVISLSLMVLFTARLTWTTFFLRTHYRD